MIFDFLLPFLSAYGLIALFLGSFITSFIFFPGFMEFSIILFLGLNFNPVLIFLSLTLGSISGGLASYCIGLFGSNLVFKDEKRIENMKKWIERWGNLSVLTVSALPVPFPFATFAILAGFLKMDIKSFILAMTAGKSLRVALSIAVLVLGIDLLKFYHILI
jgi:membrane protein YqaA with SNARE-associated domain